VSWLTNFVDRFCRSTKPRPQKSAEFVICLTSSLGLQSQGRGFDSQSDRCRVVTTWMGDRQQTGKSSRYKANTNVNSAFYTSGVGKSNTGLFVWACSPVLAGRE